MKQTPAMKHSTGQPVGRPATDHADETTAAAEECTSPDALARAIKQLSYREAQKAHRISYKTWKAIKDGHLDAYIKAGRGRSVTQAVVDLVLRSVKEQPQVSTVQRARLLNMRTETCQAILKKSGLSRNVNRLQFAGYQVDVVSPLAVARQRRILASAPGRFTALDWKRFGVVRGGPESPQIPICGCVLIDQFSGFAWCFLHASETDEAAKCSLTAYCEKAAAAGIVVSGLLLSDNAMCFTSDLFMREARRLGLLQRTTKYNHPWSNGKVERLNRTLKETAFPAIVAGTVKSLADLQALLDVWLTWYNTARQHEGWINRGLPPVALVEQWRRTKGTQLEKLAAMGLIQQADLPHVRIMGAQNADKHEGADPLVGKGGVPYAFVIDRGQVFTPLHGNDQLVNCYKPEKSNVTLAK